MTTTLTARLISAAAITAALLSACSHEPTAADKTEDGVRAALTEYVEVAVHGDRTAEQQELICTTIYTAEYASRADCEPPYEYTSNSTWYELASIDSVVIDGDKATVRWQWHGRDSLTTVETTDTFYYQGGRWRYQYDG
ncbi:hypothetical protein [Actinobaculum sp. 313]|uniref:Rv0361 family membrane protein n=1 Tax=Actinobaculum sp. 313 TaxID=2495645 RepID=UPI000D525B2A|nr:hypothetical protein [Actinobaculum sp. 313]AWE42854.1 hypothetical protein DDD63_08990 [Actinobaculum sp. 313]